MRLFWSTRYILYISKNLVKKTQSKEFIYHKNNAVDINPSNSETHFLWVTKHWICYPVGRCTISVSLCRTTDIYFRWYYKELAVAFCLYLMCKIEFINVAIIDTVATEGKRGGFTSWSLPSASEPIGYGHFYLAHSVYHIFAKLIRESSYTREALNGVLGGMSALFRANYKKLIFCSNNRKFVRSAVRIQ